MYGNMPAAPDKVESAVEREDPKAFDGKATLKEIAISFGPPDTPKIHLLLVAPNGRKGPAPVFVGLNFHGNHTLLKDPAVRLPTAWMPAGAPGVKDNRATDAGRGAEIDVWALDQSIDRGYAVATFYCGDVDPDRPDVREGIQPHLRKPGEEPGPHDWGTVAAWAWGVSRAVDYLRTDKDLDKDRIAVVGHSRLGKAAIVAGAFDERIALVIPLQAGCGGTAPSRSKSAEAESVKIINTHFPHWFDGTFKEFNDQVDRLPFDQNCLAALVAPRPLLYCTAVEDKWAQPARAVRDVAVGRLGVSAAEGRWAGDEGAAGSRPTERRRPRLLHPAGQAFDDARGLEGVPGLCGQAAGQGCGGQVRVCPISPPTPQPRAPGRGEKLLGQSVSRHGESPLAAAAANPHIRPSTSRRQSPLATALLPFSISSFFSSRCLFESSMIART